MSGDIEICPGPINITCSSCAKTIRKNQSSGVCLHCKERFHQKCLKDCFENGYEKLYCRTCFVDNSDADYVHYSNPTLNNFVKTRGLKVFHLNVNGILGKMDKLKLLLSDTHKNIQIFSISETHLHTSISDTELCIDGYTIIRKDCKKGTYGGVLCYIRNDISFQRRLDLEKPELEAIWIELFIPKSKSLLISVVYKPPESSRHLHKNFTTIFDDMISTAVSENKEILLSGDLNVNYLERNHQKELKDVIKMNGFKQVIDKPTRITKDTKTLIDIVITTDQTKIADTIVFPCCISDHELIGVVRKLHIQKFVPQKSFTQDYSKYTKDQFKDDIRNLDWQSFIFSSDINLAWREFKQNFSNIVDKHVPLKETMVRGKISPWFTRTIKTKMIERDYVLKQARRTNSELHWSRYKTMRNFVTSAIRKAKSNYCRNLFRNSNPDNFWENIKKCLPTKKKDNSISSLYIQRRIQSFFGHTGF